MSKSDISPIIAEKAPIILAEIKKAKSILLHCHPSPDPDSVGSALAMKFALEQMGKKVTVIRGDSEIPQAFMHFPGVKDIVEKNFGETDLTHFDLFIIQDVGSIQQISRYKPISFPLPIKTVLIDHHSSNDGFADINLLEKSYPATAQILYELFSCWKIKITKEIASNLFMGIYTDTGGFKYPQTTEKTFNVAAELVKIIPDYPRLISEMENSRTLKDLTFQSIAFGAIETFLDNRVGLSVISNKMLKENQIPAADVHSEQIVPVLRSVRDWVVSGILVEIEPGQTKMSFRSKDGEKYNVSILAAALGGGGHKAASGATLNMSIEEAKSLVVAKAKELYNL